MAPPLVLPQNIVISGKLNLQTKGRRNHLLRHCRELQGPYQMKGSFLEMGKAILSFPFISSSYMWLAVVLPLCLPWTLPSCIHTRLLLTQPKLGIRSLAIRNKARIKTQRKIQRRSSFPTPLNRTRNKELSICLTCKLHIISFSCVNFQTL